VCISWANERFDKSKLRFMLTHLLPSFAVLKVIRQDLASVPAVILYAVSILAEVQSLSFSNDEGFKNFFSYV
jgi:hypothetical protein